jgi:hypothetical protein
VQEKIMKTAVFWQIVEVRHFSELIAITIALP